MTSEKMRWVHDCTHTKGHKMYGDPVERSLGHWFAACPHCAKPNPYHEKPTPPASHDAGKAVAYVITDSDGIRIVRLAEHVDPLRLVAVDVAPLVLASDYATLAAAPSAHVAPVAGVDVEKVMALVQEYGDNCFVEGRDEVTSNRVFAREEQRRLADAIRALLASAPAVPVAQKPWRTMAQHAASGGMPIFVNEETAGKLRDLDGWDVFEVYRDAPAVPVGDGWVKVPRVATPEIVAELENMLTRCHTVEESWADLLRAASPAATKEQEHE